MSCICSLVKRICVYRKKFNKRLKKSVKTNCSRNNKALLLFPDQKMLKKKSLFFPWFNKIRYSWYNSDERGLAEQWKS